MRKWLSRHRLLVAGWLAFGLALGGIGSGFVLAMRPAPPKLVSDRSLSDIAHMSRADTIVHRISGRQGAPYEVLFVGAPECHTCQRFIKEGLGPLVEFAKKDGLSVGYVPFALGPAGASIDAASICAQGDQNLTPEEEVDWIRKIYALSNPFLDELEAIGKSARAGKISSAEAISQINAEIVKISMASRKPMSPDEFLSCHRKTAEALGKTFTSIAGDFNITGTPSFLVNSDEGTQAIVGFSDFPHLQKEIASIVSSRR